MTGGGRQQARELLNPAFAPLYDAETREMLAELESRYDPASLFRGGVSA
ncbi:MULTISPECIES: hypothetical protein [Streptomyces]|nr:MULTISPECIES: hypothetical protein [Streptomyces]